MAAWVSRERQVGLGDNCFAASESSAVFVVCATTSPQHHTQPDAKTEASAEPLVVVVV